MFGVLSAARELQVHVWFSKQSIIPSIAIEIATDSSEREGMSTPSYNHDASRSSAISIFLSVNDATDTNFAAGAIIWYSTPRLLTKSPA